MKLKTLKDLDTECNEESVKLVSMNELKAEAVKWVKYYQKKKFIDDESAQWLRMWIIKFFNITEEELK